MKRIGLIVNPVAGMGGRVGLKGTDGVVDMALQLGANPQAPNRTKLALEILKEIKDDIEIFTCTGDMGENEANVVGLKTKVVMNCDTKKTSCDDTMEAAKIMLKEKVDLILFAGGDGTARDIYKTVGEEMVVIGIPAGVKIHSAVYAKNPSKAGELAKLYIQGKIRQVQEAEVLDIDEDAYRSGKVNTRLHGYLRIPFEKTYLQNRKAGTPMSETASQKTIALDVIDNMENDSYYIVGPGTTTREIMQNLGLPCTLLGVDVIYKKELVTLDVSEKQLLEIVGEHRCKVIVTPIGGQGYLFGRGNQQISPNVLRKIEKKNIIVIATKKKISELYNKPFLIDTGDRDLDTMLSGYVRVAVGYREQFIYPVKI